MLSAEITLKTKIIINKIQMLSLENLKTCLLLRMTYLLDVNSKAKVPGSIQVNQAFSLELSGSNLKYLSLSLLFPILRDLISVNIS